MEDFYSRLSYSIGNEDWRTESEALKIQPTDRVLSVTASGDRPLNLLRSECQELVTIDANPIQNALFDLKKASLANLEYDDYLSFLGATPGNHKARLETFSKLEGALEDRSVLIWRKHKQKIARGVLYEGAVEKWTRRASYLIKGLRGKKVEKLFSFEDMEEQKGFVEREWNCPSWKRTLDLALHPLITRIFLNDPGLYAHVDPSIKASDHIYNRMTYALKQFPARESLLLSLIINGRVMKEGFTPYLCKNDLPTIKRHLDRVRFETADLLTYLESVPEKSFDCFSLSDVASYLDKTDFFRLAKAVLRAARPGARFCVRQFMSRYTLPEEFISHFQRDLLLEEKLAQEDRCFLYHFMVGKVLK